jgi:signal transduction histidine kinase/CheY-like chemotaxis protein
MQPAPIPANDTERVQILRSLGLLDSPPEPDYDELTHLAAQICQVPIALMTLIDRDRQWFKSQVGIGGSGTSRDASFCGHAIAVPGDDVFIVPDTNADPRFHDNPLVTGDPNIRFYAGAPLVTHDGWSLGTLCVIDRQPRELSADQLRALSTLRRHVINAIELRRVVEKRNRLIADLELARRSLEEARGAAVEATRAKAEFLAAMSHEIRTPMNAVIGMTTLLRDSRLTAEQRESVELIHESGEHLLSLVNDVLDFSKVEAGRIEIEYAPCDLERCVQSAVALVAPRAREKKLALGVRLSPSLPKSVAADPTRLRQILVNLLANAVKFTERGEIGVSADAQPRPDGSWDLAFQVRDTGIGIPTDRLDRLFRPFTQVETSTARTHGGTGLGLSISKRLAELHGGRMWVDSAPGHGSVFHFTVVARPLPAAAPAPAPSGPEAPSEFDPTLAQRHPARILVAEDSLVNQKVLVRMLAKLGYRPSVVGDGRAAVTAVAGGDFDLVLMDVEMPELNGPAATQEIRRLPAARQPVIVAVTAHAFSESRAQLLAAGMDGYLSKPIQLAELIAMLGRFRTLRR